MSGTELPDAYLVAAGWLRQQLGLDGTQVGQILPPRTVGSPPMDAPWVSAGGFVQLTHTSALASADELELRQDVFAADCFACRPNSVKPAYGIASLLAERAYATTKQRPGCETFPPLPTQYVRAHVRTVNGITRPRRFPDAESTGLARFQFEFVINWTLYP